MKLADTDEPQSPAGQLDSARGRAPGGAPLVSIVTPCLDPGERLARCLDSVDAQTYGPIEHIVVDGGSSDGTVERLSAAGGVVWRSRPDGGQTNAINDGFELATGSILTWLNADDLLLPGSVASAVEAFRRSPELGFVYGDCRVVEGGREVLTWRPPRRLTLRALEAGSSIPQPGSFIARWALERIGRLDESFDLAMDLDLWLRLLAAGVPNRRIPGIVSVFELHESSKSGSLPRKSFYDESARAFMLAGLPGGAALALGQGAAAAATREGRVSSEQLEVEIRAAQELGSRATPPLPPGTIRAAGIAEAAVIELRTSLAGLRRLLVPRIWREPAIRRRLRFAVRRGAPRVVQRVAARRSSRRVRA